MRFAILAAALALAAPAAAQTTFNFTFDNTADGLVSAPIVGTGSFTTSDTLGAGDFALTSLSDFSFSFAFDSQFFTEADMQTPIGNVVLRITNAGATNFLNFGGTGGGPFGGSLDFINGTSGQLSFQPGFGALYFHQSNFGTFEATSVATGAVPEPSSWLMLLAGFGLVGAIARRRAGVVAA